MPDQEPTAKNVPALLKLREKLMKENLWSNFPAFPKSDWRYEVGNDDTILGYWDWVFSKLEALGSR